MTPEKRESITDRVNRGVDVDLDREPNVEKWCEHHGSYRGLDHPDADCPACAVHYIVIVNSTEKYDVLQPDVVGPFPDGDAAAAWIRKHPRYFENDLGSGLRPPDGGYASYTIVCRATAATPEDYTRLLEAEVEG